MPFPKKFERRIARQSRAANALLDPSAEGGVPSGGIPHEGIPAASMLPPKHKSAPPSAAAEPKDETPQPEAVVPSPVPPESPAVSAASVKSQIRDLVRKSTQYRIPGQGAMSSRPDESFDDFRKRALPVIRAAMQDLAHNPQERIGIVVHSQTISLLRAWIDAGMPDDYSVNPEAMLSDGASASGTVERLFPVRGENGWDIEPVDLNAEQLPAGSIYLISHGMTDASKEGYAKSGQKQNAMAEMVKHVKSMDFGRARAFAKRAATEHGMSDEEIASIIDGALPSAEVARHLPHHHLLTVASAAGPNRRREYEGVLRERFGDLGSVSLDGQKAIRAHLAQLGVNL
jgi:hypothetical protein